MRGPARTAKAGKIWFDYVPVERRRSHLGRGSPAMQSVKRLATDRYVMHLTGGVLPR